MKKLILLLLILGVFITGCNYEKENFSNPSKTQEKSSSVLSSKPKSSSCDFIENKEKQDECYYKVANQKRDYYMCSKIKDTTTRDNCYYWLAKELKNHSVCNLFTNTSNDDYLYCVLFIGWDINSPEVCKDIKVQELKDDCYSSMALHFENEETEKGAKRAVEKVEIYNCLTTCFEYNYTYGILLKYGEKRDCEVIAREYYSNVVVEDKRYFFGYTPTEYNCCCYNVKFYDTPQKSIWSKNED